MYELNRIGPQMILNVVISILIIIILIRLHVCFGLRAPLHKADNVASASNFFGDYFEFGVILFNSSFFFVGL